jgi:hypothetical protein
MSITGREASDDPDWVCALTSGFTLVTTAFRREREEFGPGEV